MNQTIPSPRRTGAGRALRRAMLRHAVLPFVLPAVLAACATAPGSAKPGAAGSDQATEIAGSRLVPQTAPEIHRIEALGRTLYTLDIAAARATDIALAEGADLRAADMRGWVTDASGTAMVVRFVRQRGDRFEAAWDVTFVGDGQPPVLTRPADPALTPEQSAQLAARQLAAASLVPLCKLPYDPVAFRDPGTRDWRVYFLAASADPQVKVYAGHQRVLVSADGSRVLPSPPLSRNCLAPRLEAPAGQRPEAFLMTESVSSTPTEAHVFASLLYGLPILVVTAAETRHWIVDQGRIWGAAVPPQGGS